MVSIPSVANATGGDDEEGKDNLDRGLRSKGRFVSLQKNLHFKQPCQGKLIVPNREKDILNDEPEPKRVTRSQMVS